MEDKKKQNHEIREMMFAQQLRTEQFKKRIAQKSLEKDGDNKEDLSSTRQAFNTIKASIAESKFRAFQEATSLAFKLRKDLKDTKFDAFIILLLLAVAKDLTDIPGCVLSICTAGTLSNVVISLILFIVLFGRKYRKFLTKRIILYVLAVIIEFLPGPNIVPTYTLSIILMKIDATKMQTRLKSEIMQTDKEIMKLQN